MKKQSKWFPRAYKTSRKKQFKSVVRYRSSFSSATPAAAATSIERPKQQKNKTHNPETQDNGGPHTNLKCVFGVCCEGCTLSALNPTYCSGDTPPLWNQEHMSLDSPPLPGGKQLNRKSPQFWAFLWASRRRALCGIRSRPTSWLYDNRSVVKLMTSKMQMSWNGPRICIRHK